MSTVTTSKYRFLKYLPRPTGFNHPLKHFQICTIEHFCKNLDQERPEVNANSTVLY